MPGLQSPQTLFVEAMKLKYGVDIGIIPFNGGGGQIRPEVVSNRVQFAFYTESMTLADGDKVKLLATSGANRLQAFPSVPTFTEVGDPDFGGFWISLNGVRNMPKAVVDRLYAAAKSTAELPDVRAPFAKLGLMAVALPPSMSTTRVAAEARFSGKLPEKPYSATVAVRSQWKHRTCCRAGCCTT